MTLRQTLHHQGWTSQDIAEMFEDFRIMIAGGDAAEMAFEIVFERDWEDWESDAELQAEIGSALAGPRHGEIDAL